MEAKAYRAICEDISLMGANCPKAEIVTGGIKNDCYRYLQESKVFFVKKYNQDTRYAKHLSKTRCESEFAMCKYLSQYGCAIVKPLYCSTEMQINVFEYIEGKNLFDHPNIDEFLIKLIIDELVKIHKIPVFQTIFDCSFFQTTEEDIVRHLNEAISFLKDIYKSPIQLCDYQNIFAEIASIIISQPQVFGSIQLHNGNIMVEEKGNRIWFVDFEKAPPHFPQLDLVSFINIRDYAVEIDFKIIEYYLDHFPNVDKINFYQIYDLLFVIDNLRAIKKIKKNEEQYKIIWIEQNGIRKKLYKKSDSTIGLRWNKERKESIEKRIGNIYNKIYSDNKYALELRRIASKITNSNEYY